jgi:hypothetical protein
VLGAFLVLPALLAVQKTMTGRTRDFFAGAATSMILVIQLLLAFSRSRVAPGPPSRSPSC